jgi:hypothetical protein
VTEPASVNSVLMKQALAEGFVCTPGGFRRRLFVHQVRVGQAIVKRAGISHVMDMATMQLAESPAHETAEESPADQAGGWVTWASWNNQTGAAVSSFATKWQVPPAPAARSGQLIYLFNGLQDLAGSEILQPVLQWGSSGAGGGDYWSVASWHVDSKGHAYCTPSLAVNVGDVLTGLLILLGEFADGSRNYSCEFQGIAGTRLMALGLSELVAAEETLEAYGISNKLDYPTVPSTPMTQIDLQVAGNPAPLAWVGYTIQNPKYGEHTKVVKNTTPGGEVDLYY